MYKGTHRREGPLLVPARGRRAKRLGATAVSQEDIRHEMSAIAGKAVLFLDTCHANRAVAARGLGPAGVDIAIVQNDYTDRARRPFFPLTSAIAAAAFHAQACIS